MSETRSDAGALPWHEWRSTGSVLVVDDEEPVRKVLARALGKVGITADLAYNGAEAVSLFSADPARYRLVMLDLKLPGMDTAAILRELRALKPGIPVVIMSGYNRRTADETIEGFGLAGFVSKPFNMEMLVSVLRAALGDA